MTTGQTRPAVPLTIYREGDRHPQAAVCAACEVRGAALFGALDMDGLDRIHTHIDDLACAAGEVLYGRGTAGQAVYTVRAGVVRFERTSERGDRRIVRLAGRGDLIGQEALVRRPYADAAIACTPVQLCRIPRHLIDDLMDVRAGLPDELMLRWQTALDAAEAWVADLSTGPARRRMLHLLLRLETYADGDGVAWLPRREDIGAMLDITMETASRLVSALRREGVLELVAPGAARIDGAALRQAVVQEDAA